MRTENRALGFYLGLIGGLLAIAAFVGYLFYGNATGERNPLILIPLLAAVILQVIFLRKDSDLLAVVAPALCAVALSSFLIDSINTLVGYFLNLDMFGDASMIGFVAAISVLSGLAVIVLVISAFLPKNRVD